MEIKNEIKLTNNIEKNNQKEFLETTLGKAINTAIDIGIRALLPDFLENQIIDLKDNLIDYGLKEGISKTINNAIDLGKSTIGILTGNFENINQVQSAIQTGGVIDGISDVLDFTLDKVGKAGLINYTIENTIREGKDIILNNVKSNIENTFNKQYESIEKVENYINNWKENYENRNFEGMEKQYKKLVKEINNIVPLEKTINEARSIENLHILIKNNGQNFDLTQEQLELSQKI